MYVSGYGKNIYVLYIHLYYLKYWTEFTFTIH